VVQPFRKFSPYQNLFTGISWIPSASFNLKMNVSSGVRIPNLAELSSNGLHEGIYTYEIGNPLMKNEYNLMGNLHAEYTGTHLGGFVSPFVNRFFDFVYLAPTSEEWYGFPVFRFRQQNALQYGGEAGVSFTSGKLWKVGCNASGMISKTDDGLFTPFVPATRFSPFALLSITTGAQILRFNLGADYCLAQKRTYPGEVSTGEYFLLNASVNTRLKTALGRCELSLGGNNLLNRAYYDNLSRFKSYGLLNIGRNIFVSLRWFVTRAE
jgi:iron complex outermembrane receptor protein